MEQNGWVVTKVNKAKPQEDRGSRPEETVMGDLPDRYKRISYPCLKHLTKAGAVVEHNIWGGIIIKLSIFREEPRMTQVVMGENEGIDSALRRFKRQVSKAGILADEVPSPLWTWEAASVNLLHLDAPDVCAKRYCVAWPK